MNPVEEDQGQRTGAYDDPEGQALQKRTGADAAESLLVQAGADEEKGYGEADLSRVIEDAKGCIEGGQQRC